MHKKLDMTPRPTRPTVTNLGTYAGPLFFLHMTYFIHFSFYIYSDSHTELPLFHKHMLTDTQGNIVSLWLHMTRL